MGSLDLWSGAMAEASTPGLSADSRATAPAQIPPDAWSALDLLEGERVLRCWKTGFGFLVMTNLRCVHVWRKQELFASPEWQTGPTFLFYNMAAPRIVARRFLQLSEEQDIDIGSARFLIANPDAVRQEIDDQRAPGQAEWRARKAATEKLLHHPRPVGPGAGATVIVREVVKVRCQFCGTLMNPSDAHCPNCGAPQR